MQAFPLELLHENLEQDQKGEGERRKTLATNPTILKTCVCPQTQFLIGAVYSRTCIKRHRIEQSPSIKWSVFKVPKITSLDVL